MLLKSATETINVVLVDRPKISFGWQINLDFLLKNLLPITFFNFLAIQVNYFPAKRLGSPCTPVEVEINNLSWKKMGSNIRL